MRRCAPPTQSPKHNTPSHTSAPKMVPIVHCVNVVDVPLLNSIKTSLCSQNIANQMSRRRPALLVPPGTPEGDSLSPTVLQVSRLAVHLPRWRACAVSPWVERTVATGYRLQFRARPPRFHSVVNTVVGDKAAAVLREEIHNLLNKSAIRVVPASDTNKGWYSRYFVVPKKGGGLRPILDLRVLNKYLRTYKFKMLTLRQLLSAIRPGDWFTTIDLTDAYFHVAIHPDHRQFLRFAFEGIAYEYLVLPFGLSLAPRTFTNCKSGRLGSYCELQGASSGSAVTDPVTRSNVGLYGKSTEKLTDTEPTVFFPRFGNMLRLEPGASVRAQGGRVSPLPRSVSVGPQTAFSNDFTVDRHDGIYDRCSAARAVKDASVSTVDFISPAARATSPPEEVDDHSVLHVGSSPVERTRFTTTRVSYREGVFPQGGIHRRVPEGLGGSVRGRSSERGLDAGTMQAPHQPPGAISDPFGSEAFSSSPDRPSCSDQDRQHNGGFLHKQAGRDTLPSPVKTVSLSVALVQCSFSVPQSHSCSRALEPGTGSSLQGRSSREGVEIAPSGGVSDMGPLWQSRSGSLCLQREYPLSPVLLHDRPQCSPGNRCAGTHMAQHTAVCISPSGNDFVCSGEGAPAGALPDLGGSSLAGKVVVCRDNQSASGEALAASSTQGPPLPGGRRGDSPTSRTVVSTCLPVERSNLIAQGLPPNVVATIQSARASSTRGLYAYKWRAFEQWCQDRHVLPFQCSIVDVLTFLQELLDRGLSFSTIKVYLAAISACHVGFDGVTPGAHPLTMRFLKGVRRLRPVLKPSVPSWDLPLVLEALCGPPFEPIESVDMKFLSYKTALLLALTSAKRVGDLHALSVHPSCTQFTPDGSKVTLRPNAAYLPKIIPAAYSSMTFELLSYCPPPFASEEQRRLRSLCPVRALRTYIDRTQGVRLCDQLFVCFANPAKGRALSKQRLSHWIVEAISQAYSSRGLPLPQGVRAHSTRGMAASWALFKGASVSDICAAASWSSPHTFVRFYRLDVTAPSVAHSVLSAGSTMH